MDGFYRLKKRMVYPEKLTLDRVKQVPDTRNQTSCSWCSEPLEDVAVPPTESSTMIQNRSAKNNGVLKNSRSSSSQINGNGSSSMQFIQERIRHLVQAFSYRTNQVRRRLEMPPTPSSMSSQEDREADEPDVPRTPSRSSSVDSTSSSKSSSSDDAVVPRVLTRSSPRGPGAWCRDMKKLYLEAVVNPQENVYAFWMLTVTVAFLYNCWTIPLRATFPYQTPENRAAWMFFDYAADAVYLFDMVIFQPRIMYISDGFWIKDLGLIRKQYFKKRNFKRDLLSLVPLDLLYLALGPDFVILRSPRLLKLHSFWDFFSHVDRLLPSPHMVRVIRTLLYMMYLIHVNACAYYALSAWEGIGSNPFVFSGRGNAYIVCFYFATKTATSIGKNPKPKEEAEFVFMTFSWLMGVFVFALLIGQIRDIIATATRSQSEYKKLVDETLVYLRRLNLPQDMQRRVQMWFQFTWETQHTLDENRIMDCLPHKMKTDIAINVHIGLLSKVKLFADCDEALLRELVLKLRSVIYLPGDSICRKGDVGKEMYIVQYGNVQVIGGRNDNEVLATLSEGSVFGEISLLGMSGMNRRTANVRSKGYSNLFVLSKADLNEALAHYPEAQEILNKKAKMLMRRNASLERKEKAVIVIENPEPAQPTSRLLETVMQVVPHDSKANRLLRYGSKGWSRKPKEGHLEGEVRNSLPMIFADKDHEKTFQGTVTVHREMC